MKKVSARILILSSLLFILNVGCSGQEGVVKQNKKPQWSDKIERFAHCQALSEYLYSFIQEDHNDGIPADAVSLASSFPQHYQNQEDEVLEGDIVQSSEDYFYFVRAFSIEVIKKANLNLIKSIPIDELYSKHYLIYNQNKLYFIGSNYSQTKVKVFDEMNNFSIIFDQSYDGNMIDYRWVENNLVVVTQKYLSPSTLPADCSNIYQSNWKDGSSAVTYIHKINFYNQPILSRTIGVLGYSNAIYMTKKELLLFDNSYSSYFRKISWQGDAPELKQVQPFDGYLKDRFSIYKKGDYLILAVTKWQFNATSRSNQILIFKADNAQVNSNYQFVSQSEPFGLNEDIRSVLYRDHYVYVVTFEQTDPLFIIDIHNPMEIKILSDLESPGFSTQLKSLSPSLLAGLGFNSYFDSRGSWIAGLKLSLFNVKNEFHPRETQTLIWGERGSFSEATTEPKAFYVSPNKSLVIFPAVIMKYDHPPGFIPSREVATELEFAGALVLQKHGGRLRELGRLTHSDWREEFCGKNAIREVSGWGGVTDISGDIQRVIEYEGDYLSFSRFGVKRTDSNYLATQYELKFSYHSSECGRLNNFAPVD